MKINFESNKKQVHLTLSINKKTLEKFKILFPNVNISKSVENSMLNKIEKDLQIREILHLHCIPSKQIIDY